MKKLLKTCSVAFLAITLASCSKSTSKFLTLVSSTADNATIVVPAIISYADGKTEDASVTYTYTKKALYVSYSNNIKAMDSDGEYADYGYASVTGGILRYSTDASGKFVSQDWVLAGEKATYKDYVPSASLIAEAEWTKLDKATEDGYTYKTDDVDLVRLMGSVGGVSWLGSYTTECVVYGKNAKDSAGNATLVLYAEVQYYNPLSQSDAETTLHVTVSNIGSTTNAAVSNYLANEPAYTAVTDWPETIKEAMMDVNGEILPFAGVSYATNFSVVKSATGKYVEWYVDDFASGDKESDYVPEILEMGYEFCAARSNTVTGKNGSYTAKAYEKVKTDATPNSAKSVYQIQCNFVNNDYLNYNNGSGIMQIYGSVYQYPFSGETSIIKSSETGANAWIQTIVDKNDKPVFPEIDFGDYGDEVYMQDQSAKFGESCAFYTDFYLPYDSDDDDAMAAFRTSVFDKILDFDSFWEEEETYQLYYQDSYDEEPGHLYADDSQIVIETANVDYDEDGEKEKCIKLEIIFFYYED